ncbi:MAG TPA: YggS family pyridoxal phosphate-dependent enzyme [Flavobacteriales bacterium]|nr:YggS family pyridoxal phosphate-dependent enzyme [Flavobacteriales bacterium]
MGSIQENLKRIQATLPEGVKLCAVSKTKPNSAIEEAYATGQRIFGENRVQELEEKATVLPKDIQWHLIGHLQSNKVKYIAPFVSMIHAVDDEELLAVIDKEAKKNNRVIDCLIQLHIAQEETKYGMSEEEAYEFFRLGTWKNYKNVRICGLMGMATFTENEQQIRNEFKGLAMFFNRIKSEIMSNHDSFNQLSIGMSGDYLIAIESGSTLVRVGSAIFGDRN